MWGIGDEHGHSVSVAVGDTAAPGPAADPALIAANHILLDQGVVDGFGHVWVWHDKRPDRFLLARNMASGHVAADDILGFTLDGARWTRGAGAFTWSLSSTARSTASARTWRL